MKGPRQGPFSYPEAGGGYRPTTPARGLLALA